MSALTSIRPVDSGRPLSNQDRYAIENRIERSSLHSTGALLLRVIAKFAGFGLNPKGCFATTETLLESIGGRIKPRQAGKLLDRLEREGWIVVIRLGKSKFARRVIFLGPRCLNDDQPSAPSTPVRLHLALQCDAPSTPVPTLPPTGDESRKTTTTEPRESLSFSSRPDPESPIAAASETSRDFQPPDPIAIPEFDQAEVKTLAARLAALGIAGLSGEVADRKINALPRKLPGLPPAQILEWLADLVASAEGKAGGKDPVRSWAWFESTLGNCRADGAYTPGFRKPPVAPTAPAVVHRRPTEDPKPPPERMTVQELDQEISRAREDHSQAIENQNKTPLPLLQSFVDRAGTRLAALERERAARPMGGGG